MANFRHMRSLGEKVQDGLWSCLRRYNLRELEQQTGIGEATLRRLLTGHRGKPNTVDTLEQFVASALDPEKRNA